MKFIQLNGVLGNSSVWERGQRLRECRPNKARCLTWEYISVEDIANTLLYLMIDKSFQSAFLSAFRVVKPDTEGMLPLISCGLFCCGIFVISIWIVWRFQSCWLLLGKNRIITPSRCTHYWYLFEILQQQSKNENKTVIVRFSHICWVTKWNSFQNALALIIL